MAQLSEPGELAMRQDQRGFTYLGLLFVVAIAGIALAATGMLWSTQRQREREQELLFVGNQIREAIGNYYQHSPGLVKHYPAKLDDLLKDNRYITVQRYLRQRYVDPMTNTKEWGLIMAPEGGVMGVYSLSTDMPIKQAGFVDKNAEFEAKSRYSDWKFLHHNLP
jgi:type II secretory pathway pseudopilin PulG